MRGMGFFVAVAVTALATPAVASISRTPVSPLAASKASTISRTIPSTASSQAVSSTNKQVRPARQVTAKARQAKTPATPAVITPAVVVPLATATTVSQDGIDSTLLNTYNTDYFGALLSGTGDFSNTYDFTLLSDVTANAKIGTIDLSGVGVDFTHIFLDGVEQTLTDSQNWILDPVALAMGDHSIVVTGTIGTGGSGSYGGNLNITNVPSGVPEPGTWGLMLLGFLGVGYSIRRRQSAGIAQLV